jgi:hypothetical protein
MATFTNQDSYLGDIVDDRPGDYYVSIVDGSRYALIAGPFDTHRKALAMVPAAKKIAEELDPRAVFYGFGTCRKDTSDKPRLGILNDKLGIT